MGVIDDFKQEKNKKTIIIASEKMISDKYNINIDNKELLIIIENIILSICNDAILIKNVVKLIELNTIALTKIKDYVEKNIINKKEEIIYQPEHVERELINNKYDTEDLLSKVIELEEKRKTLNTIVNLDSIKEPDIPNVANNIENKFNKNSTYALINNPVSSNTNDNIELVAYIIEKMESIINNKKNISYKNLIINSYNRDWTIYDNRNDLTLSIIIDDGKKTQKFQFILCNANTNNGSWDLWDMINGDQDNLNNFINLTNKDWVISFTDFLNNKLNLGTDNININRISRTLDNNQYNITIDMKDIVLFNEYYLEYNNKYDNILLKTIDDEDIILKIIEINNNVITVLSDKNIIDYIDGTILNYKAQYTIILKYRSKIAK